MVGEIERHQDRAKNRQQDQADLDPLERKAMKRVQEGLAAGEVVTGLLYVDPTPKELHHRMNTVEAPLNALNTPDLCPAPAALDRINASLR
jgi:2-oxoglutarate ferredoxin oxidoreductase subunit beta